MEKTTKIMIGVSVFVLLVVIGISIGMKKEKDYLIDLNTMPSVITEINTLSKDTTGSWCYQETVNVSTVCGGLDTGTYNLSGVWDNVTATIDGDWATRDTAESAIMGSSIILTYSKPTDSIFSSIWRVKDMGGIFNLTIPQDCWDYSAETLNLKATSGCSGRTCSSPYTDWSCSNGTWKQLRIYSGEKWVYEEAMIWNISSGEPAEQVNCTDYIQQGNYEVNCSTNCHIVTNTDLQGNNFTSIGSGRITFDEVIRNVGTWQGSPGCLWVFNKAGGLYG